MTIQEQLQEVERTIDFKYPVSFMSMFEEFSLLLNTAVVRSPESRLLLSPAEIAAARQSIPTKLVPFMREEQSPWPDIYAFDLDSDGPEFQVVVWCDHAIVRDWHSFPVFFQWVREHCQA